MRLVTYEVEHKGGLGVISRGRKMGLSSSLPGYGL